MSRTPDADQAPAQALDALAAVLGIGVGDFDQRHGRGGEADFIVATPDRTFVVEVVATSGPPTGGRVAQHAGVVSAAAKRLGPHAVPLIVVPFMSEAGRVVCETAGVAWIDLSGNARITLPGLRVIIDGRPNRFKTPGRPANMFAPKSARVVRHLLMHPARTFTQREIALATGMTDAFVSRIVARLEAEGHVLRASSAHAARDARMIGTAVADGTRTAKAPLGGGVAVRDAALLLDDWRESYRFDKHTIIRGHVAARTGDALARFVGDTLAAAGIEHAATALAAAWQMTHFAGFRIATFFVVDAPSEALREKLGFREVESGANLWLVVPNDVGVLHGAEYRDGLRCVHPVQAYLDLKRHPERAPEAADRLRADFMKWRRDA